MLAATRAERIHAEERTAIVNAWMMVVRVGLNLIRAGQIAQSPHVFCQGCGVVVEGDVFQVLHPKKVTCLRHQYLVTKHLFYETTGLSSLSRVDIAVTAVLVASEHASRDLTINATNEPIIVICGFEGSFVTTHQVPFCRLAEAFCHVDIVPVGQAAFLHPVGCAAMDLPSKFEQKLLASPIVEPNDGEQVVATSAVLPIVTQEFLFGVGELPFIISRKHLDNTLVSAPLVIILQDLEC